MDIKEFISGILKKEFGSSVKLETFKTLAGGCINQTYLVQSGDHHMVIKWNDQFESSFFEKERNGLKALEESSMVSVPKVLGFNENLGIPYLMLEYIHPGTVSSKSWQYLGRSLGLLHQKKQTAFGFYEDNYIGALPQKNDCHESWIDFFIRCRIEPQLTLALSKGLLSLEEIKEVRKLYGQFESIFPAESAVLVHGDLWSGNVVFGLSDKAFLIDPAVHWGNREMELAFTMLFGGFRKDFYDAYNEINPLEPDFNQRVELYNLYPLLVHLNLFGTSYLGQVKRVVAKY